MGIERFKGNEKLQIFNFRKFERINHYNIAFHQYINDYYNVIYNGSKYGVYWGVVCIGRLASEDVLVFWSRR